MNRKKITKAAVTGLVAVTMVPAMAAPIVANAEGSGLNLVQSEKSTTVRISVAFVDSKTSEQVGKQVDGLIATVGEEYTFSDLGLDSYIPQNYKLANPEATYKANAAGDVFYVEVEKEVTTQTIGVNYWDVENDEQAGTGEVIVDADAYKVNTSALTDVPKGYEIANTGDVQINDGWIYVEVRPIEKETTVRISVAFVDSKTGEQVGKQVDGLIATVGEEYTFADLGLDSSIPKNYKLANPEATYIANEAGDVFYVEVEKKATTQTIGVNYWDVVNNEQAGTGEVIVDADAYKVNTSALTDVPEGYEIANTGDIQINDGWIYVEVRKAPTTKTVGVNYYDRENAVQVDESEVTVDADATYVNTSALKDVPEGYELVETGDLQINDGWIYVEVRKAPTTKTVGVNYYDRENAVQVDESEVTVDADATYVNTSALKDVPEGYELVETGDLQINDGWIYVEVRKAPTTKTIGVNYWDIVNDVQVSEGTVTVDADATNVNTHDLTDVPEGYEIVWTGDTQINDGWIYVELRPIETTKTVGLNYWDVVNNKQVSEGSVVVDADATKVNTSTFTDVPEGYELVWTGDLAINDGWVWVEVRPVEEEIPEEFLAQLNVQIVDRETGEVLNSIQFLSDEKGTADATYTFVYGEDWTIEAPEGYAFVEGTEFGDLDVAFGSQSTVEYYVEKTAEEPTQPGDEEEPNTPAEGTEESEQTDGTDTGVAMSLAGVFGTMSAALAGMVALLRRKQK
ncbi:hypothetical protein [Faecalicoccus pleomorphus]|uniref:hypothetical protein n=1 Tax=Faecalicoccus pleomorphus TaxID=1323 RepID=UPI00242FABF9|nr:hypothetical protein [Faecalicoccus pleomorphus]